MWLSCAASHSGATPPPLDCKCSSTVVLRGLVNLPLKLCFSVASQIKIKFLGAADKAFKRYLYITFIVKS